MNLKLPEKFRTFKIIVLMILFCFKSSYGQDQDDIYNRNPNQVDLEEVRNQEIKLNRLLDSIDLIQKRLIEMLETENTNILIKEKAVDVLARIKNKEVIEYLLKNEEKLRFGEYMVMDDDYDGESTCTSMIAIFNEYLLPGEVNWMIFPYILKHVDEWSYSEIAMVRELYGYNDERFNEPIHLLRFMKANAKPKFKLLLTDLITREVRTKKKN